MADSLGFMVTTAIRLRPHATTAAAGGTDIGAVPPGTAATDGGEPMPEAAEGGQHDGDEWSTQVLREAHACSRFGLLDRAIELLQTALAIHPTNDVARAELHALYAQREAASPVSGQPRTRGDETLRIPPEW